MANTGTGSFDITNGTLLRAINTAVDIHLPEDGKRIGFRIKTDRKDCNLTDVQIEKFVIFENTDNQVTTNRCS